MKTNKAFTKRVKVTKSGKLVARKPGQNHFNAKEKRSTQMAGNRSQNLHVSAKVSQLLVGTASPSKR